MKTTSLFLLAACVLLATHSAAQTPDDLAAKKAAAQQRKLKLESCAVLLKSQAFNGSKTWQAAVESHPEKNKKVLQQKLLVGQLSHCLDNILETQVDTLQGYKGNSEEFRQWSSDEYSSLIAFDLAALPAPVTLTEPEVLMTFEFEEIIEKIKAESGNKAL